MLYQQEEQKLYQCQGIQYSKKPMIDFSNLKSYCHDSLISFLEGKVTDWSTCGLVSTLLMRHIAPKFSTPDK